MEGIDRVFSAGTECRGIRGTVQEVRSGARALAHSQTLCWPQQPLEGWRRGAVRFSAPRNHGNCASSTGRAGERGGIRARRARWLRPWALPPRAPIQVFEVLVE
jgi:hypothetical protein